MRSYLGLFFIAALFSLLITPAVRSLGRWLEAYGQADDGRELRVPRLGGLAIFLAAFAAWGVLLLLPNDVRARFLSEWRTLAVLMGPGTLVLLLGLYDDLAGATPWQKLMIELLAAGTVWWAGLRIDLGDVPIKTGGAFYDKNVGQFILPYDVARAASDPDALVLGFFQETYAAAAELGRWDREKLERQ